MPKSKRQTPRRSDVPIGLGEFRNPAEPVPKAQWLFLQAVQRLVPDVLRELEHLADTRPRAADERRLRAWATTRGFCDKWLLRFARQTVQLWRDRPNTRGKFWRFPTSSWLPETPALDNPVWDARCETEAEFQARVDDYKRRVSGAEYARGAEPTKAKRRRPGEPLERHFEWLALHVVGKLTLDHIAAKYPSIGSDTLLSRSTVLRGVQDAARLAGVTPIRG